MSGVGGPGFDELRLFEVGSLTFFTEIVTSRNHPWHVRLQLLFSTLLLGTSASIAQVIDLRGQWKFHIDDKSSWADASFDDSKWENIFTPANWEDEGFNGYDGFAWYRRKFDGKLLNKNEIYYLGLGFIDDCDEVYVNGKLVGFSGFMPPSFKTAYNKERRYPLPSDIVNFSGENTIAIRVFDATLSGGIVDGRLGIYRSEKNRNMIVDLDGVWAFAISRRGEKPVESGWQRIMVPGAWEFQGHMKYDGFAWYRRNFLLPEDAPKNDLVLLLGKIDDFDQVFINGVLVGQTNDQRPYGKSESWSQRRAYNIPASALKKGINQIEILVEDMGNIGGIYEGTIGIVTRERYLQHFNR